MSLPSYSHVPDLEPPRDRRVLWTSVAAALTATLWAAAIVTTGLWPTGSATTDAPLPSADLRNYRAVDNLCAAADLTRATSLGFTTGSPKNGGAAPASHVTREPAVDWENCAMTMTAPGTTSGSPVTADLNIAVSFWKQVDPRPEFVAGYAATRQDDYSPRIPESQITHLSGLGDDAYQIVFPNPAQTRRTYVQLSMREGWVVYTASWQEEANGYDYATVVPSDTDAIAILRQSALGTLAKLRG